MKSMNPVKSLLMVPVMTILAFATGAQAGENETLNAPGTTLVDEYTLKGPVNYVKDVEPGDSQGNINVVIEIPKGSTGKWEVTDDGLIRWEFKKGKPRVVSYMGGYPANYGMIPKTAMPAEFGGDGESIDVIVLGDPIPRGSVVKAKVMGVMNLREGDEFDGKLIAVPLDSPMAAVGTLEELNQKFDHVVDKVVHWFENYKGPDAGLKVESVGSRDEALEILNVSVQAYGG